MNTITPHATVMGADDNYSPALNTEELLIQDYRLNRRERTDALIEAVRQAPNRHSITTPDITTAHRYMLHLLKTRSSHYIDLEHNTIDSLKLAADALRITRNSRLIS